MPRKKPVTVKPQSAVATMADELGAIEAELLPWRAKIAREEALRKSLRAAFETAPALESQTVAGRHYVVLLGKKASVSTINVPALALIIGEAKALAIVSCTLKALEAYPDVAPFVVTHADTGCRTLNVFERAK